MKRYEFRLDLSPEQYLPYYRGDATQVVVRCTTGAKLRFPAVMLRKFVLKDGIHGDFVLFCDEEHKGAELRRKA